LFNFSVSTNPATFNNYSNLNTKYNCFSGSSIFNKFYGTMASKNKKHFILFYDYVPNMEVRRTPVRPAHFEHTKSWIAQGKLQLGGAYSDISGAIITFECDSIHEVEEFYKNDPYYKEGLVTDVKIKEWTVVVGSLLSS